MAQGGVLPHHRIVAALGQQMHGKLACLLQQPAPLLFHVRLIAQLLVTHAPPASFFAG